MKPDIQTRADIEQLVDAFYAKALRDETIGHFFNEVVQLDLAHHMPVLYSFWESILLDSHTYRGNPMLKHIQLNRLSPIQSHHFDRWLELWQATVTELFAGSTAEEAISRARHVAALMQYKIKEAG